MKCPDIKLSVFGSNEQRNNLGPQDLFKISSHVISSPFSDSEPSVQSFNFKWILKELKKRDPTYRDEDFFSGVEDPKGRKFSLSDVLKIFENIRRDFPEIDFFELGESINNPLINTLTHAGPYFLGRDFKSLVKYSMRWGEFSTELKRFIPTKDGLEIRLFNGYSNPKHIADFTNGIINKVAKANYSSEIPLRYDYDCSDGSVKIGMDFKSSDTKNSYLTEKEDEDRESQFVRLFRSVPRFIVSKAMNAKEERIRKKREDLLHNIRYGEELIRDNLQVLNDEFPEVATHSLEVSEMADLFAQFLGMPNNVRRDIWFGGLVHDIGKLYFKDLFRFPGKYSATQKYISQFHTIFGFLHVLSESNKILSGVRNEKEEEMTKRVIEKQSIFALTHHERENGSGYPFGRTGKTMPFDQRLFSIADVFHAVLENRVYRGQTEIDEALEILRKGTQRGDFSSTTFNYLERTAIDFIREQFYTTSFDFDPKKYEAFRRGNLQIYEVSRVKPAEVPSILKAKIENIPSFENSMENEIASVEAELTGFENKVRIVSQLERCVDDNVWPESFSEVEKEASRKAIEKINYRGSPCLSPFYSHSDELDKLFPASSIDELKYLDQVLSINGKSSQYSLSGSHLEMARQRLS